MSKDESKSITVVVSKELAIWLGGVAKGNYRSVSSEVAKMIEDMRNATKKAA